MNMGTNRHSTLEIKETKTEPELFDIAKRDDLVAICYSTWFNPILDEAGDGEPPNISKILAGEGKWGRLHGFHYWGKPALGYYRSDDKAVIRQHMLWLGEAGIDFIIIDNTNVALAWKNMPSAGSDKAYWTTMVTEPMTALLDTIHEMRTEGKDTPHVVNWCANDDNWSVVNAMLDEFNSVPKYKDIWVYWNGKPFFITTNGKCYARDDITRRVMWGLYGNPLPVSEWSFLNVPSLVSYDAEGNAEQVGVCVAAQRTYMSNTGTAIGRRDGLTFYEAWKVAYDARPKVVTITWWNEWAAQRFEDENGNSLFVDNYNREYSRDIEPMEGGHGDTYYRWMKEYIRRYKAHESCPRLVGGTVC